MSSDDTTSPHPPSDSSAFLDAVANDPELAAYISSEIDATFAAASAGKPQPQNRTVPGPATDQHHSTYSQALATATKAHSGITDKNGEPYIKHPIFVADIVLAVTHDHELAAAAVLHDVIEDTSITAENLRSTGYSERIINAVEAVTRNPNNTYKEFINHIDSRDAAIIKIADILHNTLPSRSAGLTPSLAARYEAALTTLGERFSTELADARKAAANLETRVGDQIQADEAALEARHSNDKQ